jgi:hypothetical protein
LGTPGVCGTQTPETQNAGGYGPRLEAAVRADGLARPTKPKTQVVTDRELEAILRGPWIEEEAWGPLEFALVLIVMVLAAVASINPLGTPIGGLFSNANKRAAGQAPGSCNGAALTKGIGP